MTHNFIEHYPYGVPVSLNVKIVYKCTNCDIYCHIYNDSSRNFKIVINDININSRGIYWEIIHEKSCGEMMMQAVLK